MKLYIVTIKIEEQTKVYIYTSESMAKKQAEFYENSFIKVVDKPTT